MDRNQSTVAERLAASLNEDERTSEYAIEVIDQDGLVTLKGRVDSEEVRQAAIEIAEAQAGVIEVVDELEVKPEDLVTVPTRIPPGPR